MFLEEESLTPAPPRPSLLRSFVSYWLPVLLYLTVILIVSAQPRLQPPIRFSNSDKFYHVAEYLVLGLLLVRALRYSAFPRNPLAASVAAIAIGVLFGIGDEMFQATVPGRESSMLDASADAIGLSLAQVLYQFRTRAHDEDA
jgi:VanZ family protein